MTAQQRALAVRILRDIAAPANDDGGLGFNVTDAERAALKALIAYLEKPKVRRS